MVCDIYTLPIVPLPSGKYQKLFSCVPKRFFIFVRIGDLFLFFLEIVENAGCYSSSQKVNLKLTN